MQPDNISFNFSHIKIPDTCHVIFFEKPSLGQVQKWSNKAGGLSMHNSMGKIALVQGKCGLSKEVVSHWKGLYYLIFTYGVCI